MPLHTFASLQTSGSENQVSSTTTSGVRAFLLYETAAIEDVTTTRLTDGNFAHELRTLSVPFTAGSSNSAWMMRAKLSHILFLFVVVVLGGGKHH